MSKSQKTKLQKNCPSLNRLKEGEDAGNVKIES